MDSQIIDAIRAKASKLRADRVALQDQLEKLNSELEVVDAEIEKLETTEEVLRGLGIGKITVSAHIQNAVSATLRRTITKREQILTATVELLQVGTLQTDQILDALALKGVEIAGEDRKAKLRNLSAYLSRAKDDLGLEPSRLGWSLVAKKNENPAGAGFSNATELSGSQP